jgi:hypothetical protein
MSTTEIEKRLAAVERQVTDLAEKIDASSCVGQDINGWIDQIHGTFRDSAAYRQAARAGRQWRKSARPAQRRARKAASK